MDMLQGCSSLSFGEFTVMAPFAEEHLRHPEVTMRPADTAPLNFYLRQDGNETAALRLLSAIEILNQYIDINT